MVGRRNNIVMVKRATPNRVVLPNGRTFLAKYKRVNQNYLPGGHTIQRTYRGQPFQGREELLDLELEQNQLQLLEGGDLKEYLKKD